MGHHGNILTYCPLEHHVCENANVCGVLEIRMSHVPPFPVYLFILNIYVHVASYNSFQSSVKHYWTAADNVILIFPRNVLIHRNIGAGVCSSRLGLQSWGMVAFTPVKIILGEI